jgi:hypothetical protein
LNKRKGKETMTVILIRARPQQLEAIVKALNHSAISYEDSAASSVVAPAGPGRLADYARQLRLLARELKAARTAAGGGFAPHPFELEAFGGDTRPKKKRIESTTLS